MERSTWIRLAVQSPAAIYERGLCTNKGVPCFFLEEQLQHTLSVNRTGTPCDEDTVACVHLYV